MEFENPFGLKLEEVVYPSYKGSNIPEPAEEMVRKLLHLEYGPVVWEEGFTSPHASLVLVFTEDLKYALSIFSDNKDDEVRLSFSMEDSASDDESKHIMLFQVPALVKD